MRRSSAGLFLLRSAGALLVVVAFASCGARTGLFAPEPEDEILTDASTRFDAGVDAPITPPPDGSVPDVVEEPIGCIPGAFAFAPATSQIVFVLDRSRSMLFRLDSNTIADPGTPSRWTSLRDALDQTISPFSDEIAMGARFFPMVNASGDSPGACQQDTADQAIAPALGNAATILRVFDTTVPNGGTPTAIALGLAASQSGPRGVVARAMVVATDGAPNCNADLDPNTCTCTAPVPPGTACTAAGDNDGSNCLDDTATIQAIQQIAQSQNIPVFVVGIGVVGGFASTLDQMAIAGGRPRASEPFYYPAETPADLTTAFGVVRDSVARCTYVTPSAPTDPNAITVQVNGIDIPRDPSHADGWDWVDQDFGQLRIYGGACTTATATNVGGTIVCDVPDASLVDASIGD